MLRDQVVRIPRHGVCKRAFGLKAADRQDPGSDWVVGTQLTSPTLPPKRHKLLKLALPSSASAILRVHRALNLLCTALVEGAHQGVLRDRVLAATPNRNPKLKDDCDWDFGFGCRPFCCFLQAVWYFDTKKVHQVSNYRAGARSLVSFFSGSLVSFVWGSLVSFNLVSLLSFSSFGSNSLQREVPW